MKKVSTWVIVTLAIATVTLGYQNAQLRKAVSEEHAKLEITHKALVETAEFNKELLQPLSLKPN